MSDKVIPLPAGHRPRLGRTNGFGWAMMGFTRVDGDGNCFATRWFTAFGLPILPLDRYYLKEEGSSFTSRGRVSVETSEYRLFGTSVLRGSEIVRTYLYCWLLAPIVGAGPLLLYLADADNLAHSLPGGLITFILLMFVILFVSIGVLVGLHEQYRKRLAPLRVPEWV